MPPCIATFDWKPFDATQKHSAALRCSRRRYRREEPQPISLWLVCGCAVGRGLSTWAAGRECARHESRHVARRGGLGGGRRRSASPVWEVLHETQSSVPIEACGGGNLFLCYLSSAGA